jgi:hypothetical protein
MTSLDPDVLALVLQWKEQCPDSADRWLFPNVDTGRPFHADSLRDDHLHPAGQTIGVPNLGSLFFGVLFADCSYICSHFLG